MLKSTAACAAAGLLLSVSTPGAFDVRPESHAVAAEPCEPTLKPPKTPTIGAPGNLRIIKELQAALIPASWEEPATEGAGPFVPETEEFASVAPVVHPYWDLLVNRADCFISYHLRSQEQLDALPTNGESERRMPVIYDSSMDAGRFAIDPSGASPNSGGTDSQKKRPYIRVSGVSNVLITLDERFDSGFLYADGKLQQHKTFRISNESDNNWLNWKVDYRAGKGADIGEFITTAQTKAYLTGATSNSALGSEVLSPRKAQFLIKPNTWNRFWIYIEGTIAEGEKVLVSIWAADENRGPVVLYDRLEYIAPKMLKQFAINYDSSQDEATNTLSQSWNRNLVVLSGIPRASVLSLLARP